MQDASTSSRDSSTTHLSAAMSPALNANGLPRSPFMPVRKTNGSTGSLGTPRAAPANPAILKGSMTPTAMSSRPPLVPLTSSALASLNQATTTVNNAVHRSNSPMLCGDSDAGSTSTGVTNQAGLNKYAGSKLGVASKLGPTSMLSSKRYTRQMAPASPEEDMHPPPRPGSSLSHTISASDLRAKARVTSGSAPRRKVGVVPGAERADPPTRPVTPGLNRSETPSTGLQHRRARSNSKAAPPIPSVPSRPPSRAGGDYAPTRSVSRMGDYPSSAFVSASQLSGDDLSSQLGGMGLNAKSHRLDSDSSISTALAVPKSESVLVCVRVRPPAVAQTVTTVNPAHLEEAWKANAEDKVIQLADGSGNEYRFDSIITGSGNVNVYQQAAKPLIHSSMNGFDAVIFAYGQTASGKTFTLSGTPSNPGIIPQAVSEIFSYIRAHPKKEFLLRASYIEIYNEQLKDLLAPETAGQVKVRQDEKKRFFVSPLREEVVTNEQHVAQLLQRGETNRHTGQTDFNARSSRSHTVFQMVIESRDLDEAGGQTSSRASFMLRPQTPSLSRGNPDDKAVITSRLSLIDLAGSEKATSQADRRMEGAFINRSLLTLEKVIAALTEDKTRAHVPYRDSKLTQILQPSLSGEARVAVICTINPSPVAIQESTSTLKFAQRVKKVTLHAERNEIIGDKALIYRYEQTIAEMTAYIAQLETSHSVPATPRRGSAGSTDDNESILHSQVPNLAKNSEVAKAREDRAKLLGYIVNAGNLDEKRKDEAPRPVSPVKPVAIGQLPYLQEQLLDAQDRIGELEEINERQRDDIAALEAELAARSGGSAPAAQNGSPDAAMETLRKRIEELEKQNREYLTVLTNEDRTTALRSERRLAAREWSDKLLHLQTEADRERVLKENAQGQLAEERKKTEKLEKALLKQGIVEARLEGVARRRSNSLDGLALLSSESPMLDIRGSYLNLDEVADSPMVTPLRSRLR